MSTPDGGSDEKWSENNQAFKRDTYSVGGMSLRDYFAAAALPECLAAWRRMPEEQQIAIGKMGGYAALAYSAADAMLAERSK